MEVIGMKVHPHFLTKSLLTSILFLVVLTCTGSFKDIPVVFCGVNGLRPGMLDQAPLFTGVVETMHVERTLFFQDKYGHALNPESVMPLVSENAPGPVLVHGGMYLGLGARDGWINSGFYQGSTAAGLALRIWAGEAPSSIA